MAPPATSRNLPGSTTRPPLTARWWTSISPANSICCSSRLARAVFACSATSVAMAAARISKTSPQLQASPLPSQESARSSSLLLTKLRGGGLTDENSPTDWPSGKIVATGDLNNDLRTDAVIAAADTLTCLFGGLTNRFEIPLGNFRLNGLLLVDYDNDGWLDICAYGGGVRVWRNLGGHAGFQEMTKDLGLDQLVKGTVESIVAADFDNDCDTDLLLSVAGD